MKQSLVAGMNYSIIMEESLTASLDYHEAELNCKPELLRAYSKA
jgi:hypothetical protein